LRRDRKETKTTASNAAHGEKQVFAHREVAKQQRTSGTCAACPPNAFVGRMCSHVFAEKAHAPALAA
jgi:hypothetical protein